MRIWHVVGAVSHVAVRYTLQLVDVERTGIAGCSFTELDFSSVRPLTTTVVAVRHTYSPRDRSSVVSCNIYHIAQSSAGLATRIVSHIRNVKICIL